MDEQDKAMRSQSLAKAMCYPIVVATGANGGAR